VQPPVEDKFADLLTELVTLTDMRSGEWLDFLSLPPDAQAIAAQAYRDADWTKNPDTFGKVLAVLNVIGTIAGVIGSVAGAATAVNALRSL
jgi:hypothetical protein